MGCLLSPQLPDVLGIRVLRRAFARSPPKRVRRRIRFSDQKGR